MWTVGSTPDAVGFSRRLVAPLAAVAVAACTSVNTTAATFEGTTWQVTEVNGRAVPATHMYRVQFDDGRIGGRFGCNQFGGSYEAEGDRLIVDDVVSTLIGCPEPAASHETQAFLILGRPMRMEWRSGRQLTLSNPAGSIALERTP